MFTHCTDLLSATVTLGKPGWSRLPQTSSFPAALGAGHGHWSHQQTSEDHRTAPDGETDRKRERRIRVRNWWEVKKKKKKHSVNSKDAQMYLLRKTATSMSKNIVVCSKKYRPSTFSFILINERKRKNTKKYLKRCWRQKQGTGSLINLITVMNLDEAVQFWKLLWIKWLSFALTVSSTHLYTSGVVLKKKVVYYYPVTPRPTTITTTTIIYIYIYILLLLVN